MVIARTTIKHLLDSTVQTIEQSKANPMCANGVLGRNDSQLELSWAKCARILRQQLHKLQAQNSHIVNLVKGLTIEQAYLQRKWDVARRCGTTHVPQQKPWSGND